MLLPLVQGPTFSAQAGQTRTSMRQCPQRRRGSYVSWNAQHKRQRPTIWPPSLATVTRSSNTKFLPAKKPPLGKASMYRWIPPSSRTPDLSHASKAALSAALKRPLAGLTSAAAHAQVGCCRNSSACAAGCQALMS